MINYKRDRIKTVDNMRILANNYLALAYNFDENLFEIVLLVITVTMLILLLMDKTGKKYNINIVFLCIANLINVLIIEVSKGIYLTLLMCVAGVFLKICYDKGIDEINECEMKGINFWNKDREELIRKYELSHTKEELKDIKARAKRSNNYRMSNFRYFIVTYFFLVCILL